MFLAMRGSKRLVEGDNLDRVVIAAEAFCMPGSGDIVVWQDGYIVAEIEDMDNEEPYTVYTGKELRKKNARKN